MNNEKPYIEKQITRMVYNPNYGDNRVCKCGHTYYRHFDSYEDMLPCGCKYCSCDEFEEKIDPITQRRKENMEELREKFLELNQSPMKDVCVRLTKEEIETISLLLNEENKQIK